MFAVLKTGGKQYRVQSGDILRVEKLAANAGDTIQFNDVLMIGSTIGTPFVEGAGVQAEVVDQIKGEKLIHFVKRRRKHGSKRTKGHRQQLTLIKVTDLLEKGADKSGVMAALGAGSAAMPAATAPKKAAPKKAAPKKAEPKSEAKPEPKAAAKPKAAKTDAADDLTQISGVGPVIVKKLHALGVTSFAQIAGWSAAEIADFDEKLSFKGRIERDDWINQAKKLAK